MMLFFEKLSTKVNFSNKARKLRIGGAIDAIIRGQELSNKSILLKLTQHRAEFSKLGHGEASA